MVGSALTIEASRSGFVESVHHASVVLLGTDAKVERIWGNGGLVVLPRSALKPLQATAMVRAGLMSRGAELAVGCASHDGAESQVAVVERVLGGAGVPATALGCPAALPEGRREREQFLRAGGQPDSIHHECSGKHASMLATCVSNDWPTASYLQNVHPLQTAIRACVADLASEAIAASAVDGCGAPVHAISLLGLARAYGRLASSDDPTDASAPQAMRAHPELVAGSERDVTVAMCAVPGLIAKDGAEGVYALALPDGRAAAFKIEDGSLRAAPPLMCAVLRYWGFSDPRLEEFAAPEVLGGGVPVGSIRLQPPELVNTVPAATEP